LFSWLKNLKSSYSQIIQVVVVSIVLFSSLSGAASWKTLQPSFFFIHYQTSDERIAQALATQADSIYQAVTGDVGYLPQGKIAVYLCPTPECFRQKQPARVKLPDWAVGVAYPALNRIVIRSRLTFDEKGSINPIEIFKHEFAHIVLEQALEKRGGAPRWLSEGFSMYQAKQWTLHGQRIIEETTLRDNFIPLAMLTTAFPADEEAARIAYAQSFSLVAFMLNDYGKPIFHKFIDNLRKGMNTNTALSYSAGVNLKRLELEWQASLKKRHSWFSYLTNIGLLWFVLSVTFVVIYLIKRQKMKRIQERWEEEEELNTNWTDLS
jgi:hypothetical protein